MNISSFKVLYYSFGPYLLIGTAGYIISLFLPRFNNHLVNLFFLGGIFAVVYLGVSTLLSTKEDKDFVTRLVH